MRPRRSPLLRTLFILLLGSLLLVPGLPTSAQGGGVQDAVNAFAAATRSGSATARREAAKRVLAQYGEYQKGLSSVPKDVARKLDNELVQMCQEAWADVGSRMGTRLDHVVPVGTLGKRTTDPRYIPGKSDKDFIPRGPGASEAVGDFNKTFQRKFGIAPASVQVNVLDPTNPSSWPARYSAATNPEKYNTVGGNKWLAEQEWKQKPDLWRFDASTGAIREVPYQAVVRTPPPPLTSRDALGWLSDNTRFRNELAGKVTDPLDLALKQSKYDLRNLDAFRLAGGRLPDADGLFEQAAKLLREGKKDGAIGVMMQATGMSDPDRAVAAYLSRMNELNGSMASFVTENHLRLMGNKLWPANTQRLLADELSAALVNLPRAERVAAIEAMTARLGKDKADEIVRVANAFERKVSWGLTYFDDRAVASFGKTYDQLTDAERAVLHGADEAASSWLGKAASVLGVVLSGYAVWNTYEQGRKEGGFKLGVASGFARSLLEVAQAGFPVLAAAELVAQLTAGVVQLGAGAYKNATLEALYEKFKADPSALDIYGALRGYAGGLRQLAIDLKMQDKTLTDAQIEAMLRDYFTKRLQAETELGAQLATMQKMLAWGAMKGIFAIDVVGIDTLDPEQAGLLLGMYEAYIRLREQFARDGIVASDEIVWGILWHLYHPAGTFASYQAAMRDLYAGFHKTYPPSSQPAACRNKPVITSARDTKVVWKQSPPAGGVIMTGSGSFTDKIDQACDPGTVLGPVEVTSGGSIKVTLDGSPPVPCTWSLYNNGVGVSVDYIPTVGRNDGPAQRLVELSLTCDAPDEGDTHLEAFADVPGPGRLQGYLGAPRGAGPLTGACFAQSGTATVTLMEPRAESVAAGDMTLSPGDRVVTGDNGTAVLLVPGFASVRIRGASDISLEGPTSRAAPEDATCGPGATGLTVNAGGVRTTTLPGGASLPITVGGRTVTPKGTDVVAEVGVDGVARVAVLEGEATITAADGSAVTLAPDQQLSWPGDIVGAIDPPLGGLVTPAVSDLLPVDDTVPAEYGDWPADFGGEPDPGGPLGSQLDPPPLPEEWTWVAWGNDASIGSPRRGVAVVRVPDRHELWGADSSAPMLLRKVTGDVNLDATVHLETRGHHFAAAEFVVHSPGSSAGVLAGQMHPDSPAADVRLLAPGWLRWNGVDRLDSLACLDGTYVDLCPEAPGGPVSIRLTRRGDLWQTYRQTPDGRWVLTSQHELALPETVWVGWAFKRVAADGLPYEAAITTLSDVVVQTAPWRSLPPADWEVRSDVGVTPIADDAVDLRLDGSTIGSVAAQAGRRLEDDFDVVVRVEPASWSREAGTSRTFGLMASTIDDRNQAYILFQETENDRYFASDLMVDGGWQGWATTHAWDAAPSWLRLTRRDGIIASSFWSDCRWIPLGSFTAPMARPVVVRPWLANQQDATAPSALEATFRLERMADGPRVLDLDPWTPSTCTVTPVIESPAGMVIPDGTAATVMAAPFPLGSVFFDEVGTAYAMSSSRERRGLLSITPDGTGSLASESELFAGVNGKAGLWSDGTLLVTIDSWAEGGTLLGGVFEVAPDGSFRQWLTPTGFGGLTDLAADPDGGWLVTDFESDNVFRLVSEEAPPEPLITAGEIPAGLVSVAVDDAERSIWLLNAGGEWPLGGAPGIYRLMSDGTAVLVAAPPGGTSNLADLAISDGRVFPAGVYVTHPTAGAVLHLGDDDALVPVVEGVPAASSLAFDRATGDLLVAWGGDRLLRVGRPGQAEAP